MYAISIPPSQLPEPLSKIPPSYLTPLLRYEKMKYLFVPIIKKDSLRYCQATPKVHPPLRKVLSRHLQDTPPPSQDPVSLPSRYPPPPPGNVFLFLCFFFLSRFDFFTPTPRIAYLLLYWRDGRVKITFFMSMFVGIFLKRFGKY
jgi:hypothetical protein